MIGIDMRWLLEKPIAHRGLHDAPSGVPENSLAAFEAALRAGFPFELDVRLLSDGAVVVFHDESLLRLSGVDAPISAQDSRTLRSFRLSGTDHGIPLLADVLDLVGGRVGVLIEIKNFAPPGALERSVLETIRGYDGPFAVQSFNPFSMAWFAERSPDVVRGHLAGDFAGLAIAGTTGDALRRLEHTGASRPHYIGLDIRCLPFDRIEAERLRGRPIIGWTVWSAAEKDHALRWCDNIIFEGFRPGVPSSSPDC